MPSSGPLSRPHGIENEGTPLGQKPKLNFVGAGVDVVNVGNKTEVRIPGGGPEGAFELQDATDITGAPGTGKGWVREAGGSMVWTDLATQAELNAVAAAASAEVAAHTGNATAAHAASAVAFTPAGSIAATNVQAAIQEVRDEAGVGGGSVDDQTITTTDNTVNNLSAIKHGWAPKAPNNRSFYLAGDGTFLPGFSPGGNEWYVDENVPAGGDGLTLRGAFNTFAAANAAAKSRDIIYICSDLHQNCTLSKQDVKVQGLGRRVMYAAAGSALGNITLNVTARECQIDNLYFFGHSTFKGIHLCMNHNSGDFRLTNIRVDGTGGAGAATFYPTSPGAGTGVGGIGILCHHAELGATEGLHIKNCSIGVGGGTWSTGNVWNKVRPEQNAQDLVVGLWTGVHTAVADTSTPFGYGLSTHGAEDQCSFNTFRDWRPVSNVDLGGACPSIDLIGDGTTNYSGSSGGQHLFENMVLAETGAPGPIIIRIGSCGNTFKGGTIARPALWNVYGQKNVFEGVANTNGISLLGDYNVIDGMYNMPTFAPQIYGSGSHNLIRRSTLNSYSGAIMNWTGFDNRFEQCLFAGTSVITRANLGAQATVIFGEGVYEVPYSATMALYSAVARTNIIRATNTTAFTISNPLDNTNSSGTTKILTTTPLEISILNSSGGTMGTITWGSKFKLAGAFTNPANGKWRTISFSYDYVTDFWLETARAAADI